MEYFLPPQKANCLAFVRGRKSGVCFGGNQNDEERAANFLSGDEKRFVAVS